MTVSVPISSLLNVFMPDMDMFIFYHSCPVQLFSIKALHPYIIRMFKATLSLMIYDS